MFIVIVKRVIKQKDFVQATSYQLIGPFRKLSTAEKAVLRVVGVFTTLEARIYSEQEIEENFAKSAAFFHRDEREVLERAKKALDEIRKSLLPKLKAGNSEPAFAG